MKITQRHLLLVVLVLLVASPLWACTVFYAYDGKRALAGDSEDYWDANNQVWFIAPTKDNHGIIYVGLGKGEYPEGGIRLPTVKIPEGGVGEIDSTEVYGFPQQGMNDQGLFYGGAATDVVKLPELAGKPRYQGYFVDAILRKCATVAEALKFMEDYDVRIPQGQILLGDKTGDSVILESPDVLLRKKGNYQVITNFRQSVVEPGAVTCGRFKTVQRALANQETISVELFRDTLSAVAARGGKLRTQYSTVCDLTQGEVHLYQLGNFEKVVRINLKEELAKGNRALKVAELFGT